MCGIFGYFNAPEGNKEFLHTMASRQIHRGPDSEGFYTDGLFGFGIRRLSVIDLVTGNQPISNEDKTVWVVCNGEIYNYLELSVELKKRGHHFHTNSDVECIVHLYEEEGIEFLKKLNGMFGLALYDTRKKCLYIARDRIGIKPLYYSEASGSFFFSSEIKSLLVSNHISRELDWNSISTFFDLMYIPTPATPFKKIRKLKAGYYLKIGTDNNISEIPYWRLHNSKPAIIPKSENEVIEKLVCILKDSNRLQLRADVPICVFLSGGVDSSAVTAFASLETTNPLKTYHVYFENASGKIDERKYARSVAEKYGTIHTEVRVGREDFKKLIPKLIWHLEEPFGDLAIIPTYIISEMARKEATVCLNGSGGDELFAGYMHHSYLHCIQKSIFPITGRLGLDEGRIRHIMKKTNNSVYWSKLFPFYTPEYRRIMPEDKGKTFPGDCVNQIMAKDIDGYLQSNVLFLLDKITMAVSLEGRVPLLDHRFVELAAHLPSSWKRKNGERKYIFKKMLEPYLPHDVLYRKKEGFGAPLNDWLDDNTISILRHIIENGLLAKNKLIKFDSIRVAELRSWDLWKIACLELWFRIIFDSSECPDEAGLQNYI